MILDLVENRHPLLSTELKWFDFENPPVEPLDLVTDLAETMIHNNGVGLTTNQVGLDHAVFVMMAEEIICCFNPKIIDFSQENIYLMEGCLSQPDFFVKIKRPKKIKVRYTEPDGNVVTKVYDGMTSRIFQHEMDHINGVDFKKRANKIHLEQAKKKKISNKKISSNTLDLINQIKS